MIQIVKMEECHVAQVAALERICFHDPWSEKSIASELQNPLSCWRVAVQDGTVAGYVGSQTVLDETDMMNIDVHPDYSRQGLAEGLVEALVAALREKGSRCLTLEVRQSNAPAIRLYEKLGFTQIGLRKNYYRNPRENALILRKEWEI